MVLPYEANADCQDAYNIQQSEPGHIASLQGARRANDQKIDQLFSDVSQQTDQKNAKRREMRLTKESLSLEKKSIQALSDAIVLIKNTLLGNDKLNTFVQQLEQARQDGPEQAISVQLRTAIDGLADQELKSSLTELADQLEILERADSAWKATERKIIESVRDQNSTISLAVLRRFVGLKAQISAHIGDLAAELVNQTQAIALIQENMENETKQVEQLMMQDGSIDQDIRNAQDRLNAAAGESEGCLMYGRFVERHIVR